jgi:hypothetical protein
MFLVWALVCELVAVVAFWAARSQTGAKRSGLVVVGVALTGLCFWLAIRSPIF